jgi:hypothetical protein
VAAPPSSIDWLDRKRPEFRHLEPPPPTKRIAKAWVQARCRELRREIEERGAASYQAAGLN